MLIVTKPYTVIKQALPSPTQYLSPTLTSVVIPTEPPPLPLTPCSKYNLAQDYGVINIDDLISFASHFATKCENNNYDSNIDFNDDCAIDIHDFIKFAYAYDVCQNNQIYITK